MFILIKICNTLFKFAFVIASTKLLFSLIYYISANSLRSYNYLIVIIFIINFFSLIIFNLTMYLYNENKFVQIIIKILSNLNYFVIILIVINIIIAMLIL